MNKLRIYFSLNAARMPVNNVGLPAGSNISCNFNAILPGAVCASWRTRVPLQDLWIMWSANSKTETDEEMPPATIAAEIARWHLMEGDMEGAIAAMDSLHHEIGNKILVPTYTFTGDSLAAVETLSLIPQDTPENIAFHQYWDAMIEVVLGEDDGDGKTAAAQEYLASISADEFDSNHCLFDNFVASKEGHIIDREPESDGDAPLFEEEADGYINIAANPGSGHYFISWKENEKSSPPAQLQVLDSYGKIVYTASDILYGKTNINISHLPSGSYYILVTQGDERFYGKIIHISRE